MNNLNGFKLSEDGSILIKYTGSDKIVEIPDSVTEIGYESFYSNTTLVEVRVTSKLKRIGKNAFNSCSNLEYINIPDSVTEIREGAFDFCKSLKEVKIPHGIRKLEKNVLSGCRSLSQITIPDTVTEIGESALSHCSKLSAIDIPMSVTKIEDFAFGSCRKLRDIILPDSVTEMGIRVFAGCSNLVKVEFSHNFHKITEQTFDGCRKLESFMLPDWITIIDNEAFRDCDAMNSVWIHAGIEKIGKAPFQSVKLQRISVDENNPFYKSIDGILFEVKNNEKKLINFPGARGGHYKIPDGTTHINPRAFEKSSLSNLEIPLGVILPEYGIGADSMKLTGPFLQSTKLLEIDFDSYLNQCEISPIVLAHLIIYQDKDGYNNPVVKVEKELKKKSVDFSVVMHHIVDILKKDENESVDKRAIEFIMDHYKRVSSELFKNIYEILKGKNSSQVKLLKSDWRFNLLWSGPDGDDNMALDSDHPAEQIVRQNWALSEQLEKLSEMIVKGLKYANSEKYSSKEALIFVLDSYAGQVMKKIPIGGYKTDSIEVKINTAADEVARAFDQDQFINLLESLAYNGSEEFLLPYGRYATGKQITQMISSMKSWADWGFYGATGRRRIIIARSALLLSDTREAMVEIDKSGLLKKYGEIRGASENSIRNKVMSDFGFDSKGMKFYELGNRKLSVSISKDLTYILYDSDANKYFKSVPKRGADPELYELAKSEFDEMKKNLKKVVKVQTNTLFEYFLSGATFTSSEWKETFIENLIFYRIAELFVWSQEGDTFIVTPEGCLDSSEKSYEIRKTIPITIAHPIEMENDDLVQWRQYFIRNNLRQPFLQIWEPVVKPEEVREDRYVGAKISVFSFMNQIKHGIGFSYYPYDGEMGLYLKGCKIEYERTSKKHRGDLEKDETITLGKFTYEGITSKTEKLLARKDDFSEEELFEEGVDLMFEMFLSGYSQFPEFSEKYTRQINHIVFLLDRWLVRSGIRKDDLSIMDRISSFTYAQIIEFLDLAMENGSANCTGALLEYKNKHFSEYDSVAAFTLD